METYLDKLKKMKKYSNESEKETQEHLLDVISENKRKPKNRRRNICSVLGYLWETEKDGFRKDLMLEAAWMGRRMSIKLEYEYGVANEKKYE